MKKIILTILFALLLITPIASASDYQDGKYSYELDEDSVLIRGNICSFNLNIIIGDNDKNVVKMIVDLKTLYVEGINIEGFNLPSGKTLIKGLVRPNSYLDYFVTKYCMPMPEGEEL